MDAPKPPAIPNFYRSLPLDSSSERRMTVTLYSIFLPMVVAGLIVHASVEPPAAAAISATLSEVADGHLVEIRDAGGAVVLSGEFRSRVDSLGNTEKDAELTDQQGRTVAGRRDVAGPNRIIRLGPIDYFTEYFVNAPPAWRIEFGPSAANTLPSASTAMPSPAVP
jgi:hypothetical protein